MLLEAQSSDVSSSEVEWCGRAREQLELGNFRVKGQDPGGSWRK